MKCNLHIICKMQNSFMGVLMLVYLWRGGGGHFFEMV